MRSSHRQNIVGPWAKQKLDALEAYLTAHNTALKRQSFKRIYIDAFAGSPISKVRSHESQEEEDTFFEYEDSAAQQQFVLRSPARALNLSTGFNKYFFFDLDETRASNLLLLSQDDQRVTVKVGDSNPLIRNLCSFLENPNVRGVAFLDPYGAHLEWATLEALAKTQTMEVIINFPIAMAINRLITRSGSIPENWSTQLTACFGTEEWRILSYNTRTNLFGDEIISKEGDVPQRLLQLYIDRLRGIFPYVATPRLIRNTKNSPLYYIIWAGPNSLGRKIANHILTQGETTAVR